VILKVKNNIPRKRGLLEIVQHLSNTLNPLFVRYLNWLGAVCKVRGLTLLLRVGALWRCGDGLFFEAPPLTSNALLTTLHPLLENVFTSKFLASELPFHGWKSPEIAWGEI
jgi:hypothetical protein